MHSEVVSTVSSFLDAIPEQVRVWDTKVINHLANNSILFNDFKAGNDMTRWNIYAGIKYA